MILLICVCMCKYTCVCVKICVCVGLLYYVKVIYKQLTCLLVLDRRGYIYESWFMSNLRHGKLIKEI